MSDLTKFVKQVDGFVISWTEWTQVHHDVHLLSDLKEREAHYRKGQELLLLARGELSPLGEKLQVKMNQIDPISGQKRYGPTSEAKLAASLTKLSSTLTDAATVSNEIDQFLLTLSHQTIAPHDHEEEELVVNGPVVIKHQQVVEEEKKEEEHAMELSEEAIALKQAADQVRTQQQAEKNKQKLLADMVEEKLQSLCSSLSSTLSYQTIQVERLAESLPADKQRQVIKLIHTIIERVISRPDDIQLRRVRLTHPLIWNQLGQCRGGLQLLVALGFMPRLHSTAPKTDDIPPEDMSLRSREGLLLSRLSNIEHVVDSLPSVIIALEGPPEDLTAIHDLLHPNTFWEIICEMHEPSFEGSEDVLSVAYSSGGGDKQSWLAWFDQLKTHKDLLQGFL
eukprot:gene535-575_t